MYFLLLHRFINSNHISKHVQYSSVRNFPLTDSHSPRLLFQLKAFFLCSCSLIAPSMPVWPANDSPGSISRGDDDRVAPIAADTSAPPDTDRQAPDRPADSTASAREPTAAGILSVLQSPGKRAVSRGQWRALTWERRAGGGRGTRHVEPATPSSLPPSPALGFVPPADFGDMCGVARGMPWRKDLRGRGCSGHRGLLHSGRHLVLMMKKPPHLKSVLVSKKRHYRPWFTFPWVRFIQ